MTSLLTNKHILLGITGSIAAYKSADLIRRLREAGAIVRVVMTENAKHFITPLTMQALSGHPVHDDLFDERAEAAMGHIQLARWADLILIAPATADTMARLAEGRADDLLTTLCLATRAPIALAPAMNQAMWLHGFTQANKQLLQQKNMHFIGPAEGHQACGDVGPGRMLEPAEIMAQINTIFATGALAGLNVVVTAGPTREAIDPVRFMTNGSSGKMGYALAEAAVAAGATVTLISGPVHIHTALHLEKISVVTAVEMHAAVMRKIANCDIFLAVAAVSDYRVQQISEQKIHKQETVMSLLLERNPDIIASVSKLPDPPFIVGFAAETQEVLAQARLKRQQKNMDMIIANRVGFDLETAMGGDENEVLVMTEEKDYSLPRASKKQLAREIVALIAAEYAKYGIKEKKS